MNPSNRKTVTSIPKYLGSRISHVYFSVNIIHQALKPKARLGEGEGEEYCTRSSPSERLVVSECISLIS